MKNIKINSNIRKIKIEKLMINKLYISILYNLKNK